MKKLMHLILLFTGLLLSGCGVLDGDNRTFEAGPILFISDKSGTNQLYSMNEDGNNITQLTNDPNFPIYEAKWSPDGTKIAIISQVGSKDIHPSFRRAVFVMNSDGSGRSQLTSQWTTVQDSTSGSITYGGAWYIAWSPDSKQISYSRLMVPEALGSFDVFLINIDETNEKRITSNLNQKERVADWANDGTSFWGSIREYAEDSTGTAIQYRKLANISKDGHVIKSWGEPGESWARPILSQSGEEITFRYIDENNNRDIYKMNIDGSEQINLTKRMLRSPIPIAWSADDSEILLHGYEEELEGGRTLFLDVETLEIKDITPFEEGYTLTISWRN